MASRDVTSSSVIKEFELDGKKFRVLNEVKFYSYTRFVVELMINNRWNREFEVSVSAYPNMSWAQVMEFIKVRAGADKRLEEFLYKLKHS